MYWFFCLFVCWNKTRIIELRLLSWEGSKPHGSDHTGRGTLKPQLWKTLITWLLYLFPLKHGKKDIQDRAWPNHGGPRSPSASFVRMSKDKPRNLGPPDMTCKRRASQFLFKRRPWLRYVTGQTSHDPVAVVTLLLLHKKQKKVIPVQLFGRWPHAKTVGYYWSKIKKRRNSCTSWWHRCVRTILCVWVLKLPIFITVPGRPLENDHKEILWFFRYLRRCKRASRCEQSVSIWQTWFKYIRICSKIEIIRRVHGYFGVRRSSRPRQWYSFYKAHAVFATQRIAPDTLHLRLYHSEFWCRSAWSTGTSHQSSAQLLLCSLLWRAQ